MNLNNRDVILMLPYSPCRYHLQITLHVYFPSLSDQPVTPTQPNMEPTADHFDDLYQGIDQNLKPKFQFRVGQTFSRNGNTHSHEHSKMGTWCRHAKINKCM